jgi:hypothetical protein
MGWKLLEQKKERIYILVMGEALLEQGKSRERA